MILDEYLNYLHEDDDEDEEEDREEEDQGVEEDEDDEEEVEEKFALVRKLSKLAKDPLGKQRYTTAIRRHRKKVAKLKQSIKPQVKTIKRIPKQYRKKQYTLLKKRKEVASAKRSGKELKRAEKAMKWKRRARTATALSGVGTVGFHAAKRADLKGQSI